MNITADERIVELEEIRRAYIRDCIELRADLAHYKALCEELRAALRVLKEDMAQPARQTGTGAYYISTEVMDAINEALAKVKEL